MSSIQKMSSLTRALSGLRPYRAATAAPGAKSYYTYVNEPGMPIPDKEPCYFKTAEEAVDAAGLASNQLVFAQGAAATPVELLRGMTELGIQKGVCNVRLFHMHLEGVAPFANEKVAKNFRSMSLFIGGNVRKAVNEGRADAIPIYLHEIPKLFNEGHIKPDIALIHVTPPDEKGYCSLGTSVDSVRSALIHSKVIVAQMNKHMPRTFGDALVHKSHIDYAICDDKHLPSHGGAEPSKEEKLIGKHIAENLVENGATLQLGIGSIPDAVLALLKNHQDLGIHSEMFSDGVVDLVNLGIITNSKKSIHTGRIVGSFCVGTNKLYEFMDNNPFIEMLRVDYVNDPRIAAKQPKMTAINSCIEVDITGQICSDSIGTRMYSGFGGQVDFITGAAMSEDHQGKPIIALRSTTNKGASKIVPTLNLGAGVVTNRALVRYVVTEHGIASLFEQLVYVQGGAATPLEIIRALTEHGVCSNLRGVRLLHMALEGDAPFANPEFAKHFRSASFYIGANLRDAVNDGRADYIPIFNFEAPNLFWHKKLVPDVALIHVSAPDTKGFCSLGTNVDCTRAAVCTAKVLIAQVNEHMPRTFGDAVIHSSHFDWAIKFDCPLPCIPGEEPNDIEQDIGKLVAHQLVDDGATIQMGVGSVPDAILCNLGNHKDLGVHTEVFSDGMVDLVMKGAITNKRKTKHKGRLVSSMAIGTKKLYDFLHNNPFISMLGLAYTNDPQVIRKQNKMTAINSCIEMDITGQVCADSLGTKFYTGQGGQLDFHRGAALSLDGKGKSIIAMPSVTSQGESKIQPVLKLGGGVTATRAHAHYVVTEHGIANLYGKTLRQRAYDLINIAHPDHRECLEKAAYDRLRSMPTKYL